MATTAEILQKLDNLKTLIDNIPNADFKFPLIAGTLKKLFKALVDAVKNKVSAGTPDHLNFATYLLEKGIRNPLDQSRHLSVLRIPHAEVVNLCDQILLDIQSLYQNDPPMPIIKIAPQGEVPVPVPPRTVYRVRINQPYTYDGTDSYDPDPGQSVVYYKWDFGDNIIIEGPDKGVVDHTYTTMGDKPCTLYVTDDGNPPETNQDWVIIQPY